MSDQDNLFKKITAYEDNELSPEDKKVFEKNLKSDKKLAATWQLSQEVDKAIGNPKALQMEALLQEMSNEFGAKYTGGKKKITPNRRIQPFHALAIAASFALPISIGWWQWGQISQPDAQTLYANAYKPYTAASTIRSTNTDLINPLIEGQQKYLAGDYAATITLLTPLIVDKKLPQEDLMAAQFYQGLAYLATNKYSLAETALTTIVNETGHLYTQQAQWYLALIALKKEDISAVIIWLNQVIETAASGKYAKQASALLTELE